MNLLNKINVLTLKSIDRVSTRDLFIYLIAFGMLLAAWMQHIQHGWINPDSVLYLEQGRLFANGHWDQIMSVFNWPLFGICIGFVHQVSSLSIHQSAQLLSMLFFGVATASFLSIIKLAGGNNRVIFSGAALLFSSQYIVGDSLEMLMRGQGFWAFYLTALVFFIRYVRSNRPLDAFAWQLSIMIATMFRIEAIMFLIFLPLVYFSIQDNPLKQRLFKLLNSYSLSLLAASIIAIIFIIKSDASMSQLGRLDEIFRVDIFDLLTAELMNKSHIMANEVLGVHLDQYATIGLLLTFAYVIIVKVIGTTGIIPSALSTLGVRYQKPDMDKTSRIILLSVMMIALLTIILIIIKVFVLSGRYILGLTWILLIFASFFLSNLSYKTDKRSVFIFGAICVVLILSFVKNILPKADGYNYQQEAVAWLKHHNKQQKTVYYSDKRLRYYADQPFDKSLKGWESILKKEMMQPYDYIVVVVDRKNEKHFHQPQEPLNQYHELKRFYNAKRKKYCLVLTKQI